MYLSAIKDLALVRTCSVYKCEPCVRSLPLFGLFLSQITVASVLCIPRQLLLLQSSRSNQNLAVRLNDTVIEGLGMVDTSIWMCPDWMHPPAVLAATGASSQEFN